MMKAQSQVRKMLCVAHATGQQVFSWHILHKCKAGLCDPINVQHHSRLDCNHVALLLQGHWIAYCRFHFGVADSAHQGRQDSRLQQHFMMVNVHGHAGQHCNCSFLVCILPLYQIMRQVSQHLCRIQASQYFSIAATNGRARQCFICMPQTSEMSQQIKVLWQTEGTGDTRLQRRRVSRLQVLSVIY